jgi:signal transduction histidine kinase
MRSLSDRALRRIGWIAFVGTTLLMVAAIALMALSRSSGIPRGGDSGWRGEIVFLASFYPWVLVGGLIATRIPRNRIGLIFMAVGFAWGLSELLTTYGEFGLIEHPGLPEAAVVTALTSWVPGVMLVGTFSILLFPDGRLPSRRWRPWAWICGIVMTIVALGVAVAPGRLQVGSSARFIDNPLAVSWANFNGPLGFVVLLIPACILGCAWSMIVRYRRSGGDERLQLKWLATAAAIIASVYLVAMVGSIGFSWDAGAPYWVGVVQAVAVLSFCLIPIAAGFAILRYHLYDIDVVINKTLVYGSLAALITGFYIAVVVGIGHLAGPQNKPHVWLSIAATAAVAFAFQPVRERVQHIANRLVYGKRATPYEVLSRFSGRLAAVEGLDELAPRMARVLAEGIGARRVDVWVLVDGMLFHEGSWPDSDAGVARYGSIPAPPGDLPRIEGVTRLVGVRHQGELLGAIAVTKPPGEALSRVDAALLEDLAAQSGVVLRNIRLAEELRASRARIVAAGDTERRRLERNIHDGAQLQLVALSMAAASVRARVGERSDKAAAILGESIEELKAALQEIRALARGIHPSILTNQGLGPALESLAQRSSVPVTLRTELNGRAPETVEATAYFAVSEALANIAKYAHASRVGVNAARENGSLVVEVTDDGVGGADPEAGSGLRGLLDRVSAVGGRLDMHSPPGGGTTVRVTLPCG